MVVGVYLLANRCNVGAEAVFRYFLQVTAWLHLAPLGAYRTRKILCKIRITRHTSGDVSLYETNGRRSSGEYYLYLCIAVHWSPVVLELTRNVGLSWLGGACICTGPWFNGSWPLGTRSRIHALLMIFKVNSTFVVLWLFQMYPRRIGDLPPHLALKRREQKRRSTLVCKRRRADMEKGILTVYLPREYQCSHLVASTLLSCHSMPVNVHSRCRE